MHTTQSNHNAGNVVNSVMTDEQATVLAEIIAETTLAVRHNRPSESGTIIEVRTGDESDRDTAQWLGGWTRAGFENLVKRILMEG